MSFSLIVYQAAYLCRHDISVNNYRVLCLRLRCEIDSVTYAASTVISMETEGSRGSEEVPLTRLKDITSQPKVSNPSTRCSDPHPSQLPTLLVRRIYCCPSTQIKRGEKNPLLEINVAAQRAFTMAPGSIYIENTIKLSQGEKRKPHVHSVWSPRCPGTSIASLFSPALLRYQIVKKAESMTLYPLTPRLLERGHLKILNDHL